MSEVYFDVNAWEAEMELSKEEENGKKRKRPTKKDLVGTTAASLDVQFLLYLSYSCIITGALQGTEEIEEDRQDGVASYIGCATSVIPCNRTI